MFSAMKHRNFSNYPWDMRRSIHQIKDLTLPCLFTFSEKWLRSAKDFAWKLITTSFSSKKLQLSLINTTPNQMKQYIDEVITFSRLHYPNLSSRFHKVKEENDKNVNNDLSIQLSFLKRMKVRQIKNNKPSKKSLSSFDEISTENLNIPADLQKIVCKRPLLF